MTFNEKSYAASADRSALKWLATAVLVIAPLHSAFSAVPPVRIATSPLMDMQHAHAGMALNTQALVAENTFIFQAGFEAATWSGSLKKIPVSMSSVDGAIQIASSAQWDAADLLSGTRDHPPAIQPDERNIFTAHLDGALGFRTVPFKWENMGNNQRVHFDSSPLTNAFDGNGARRVQFLRGARNDETSQPHGIFRKRFNILGDIVNSAPVHVGAPSLSNSGADYQKFYLAYKKRAKSVYVGANDGMLHAFDAGTGKELFAYVPEVLIPRLSLLTSPDYVHRPFVDGAISVDEAKVREQWKTVLVAGMGGGAQGVFALDVTDPAKFGAGAGALWEFTDRDDADMGNVFTTPAVAKFRVKLIKGIPQYRYFAVVASGLNNYIDDGQPNMEAPAVLFLLSLDKSPTERWTLGVNYFKLKKPIMNRNLANGLSAPALVTGDDGAVRYGYAGDLQGNLWRFDFTGLQPWSQENKGTTPIFTATDDKNYHQPITMQPRVVFAPGGYVVLFGTGKLVEPKDLDPDNFKSQSFYGIYDNTKSHYKVEGRPQLELRTITKIDQDEALHFSGKDFRFGDAAGFKKGWYFDFPYAQTTGERSVSTPVTASGRVHFNTLIPCPKKCPHGAGRSFAVNALTGMPDSNHKTGLLSSVGISASPLLLDIGTQLSSRNPAGSAVATRKTAVINSGAGSDQGRGVAGQDGKQSKQSILTTSLPAMRYSWREILNWRELQHAGAKK